MNKEHSTKEQKRDPKTGEIIRDERSEMDDGQEGQNDTQ